MPHLIGFIGYKQSGKDTAASAFHEYLPSQFRVTSLSFATPIYEAVAKEIGQTVEWLKANKNNPVIRHLLQWYGNEYSKSVHGTDVWVKKMQEEVVAIKEPAIILFPDVRFHIEANWIKSQGGCLIRVERVGQVSNDKHTSETEMDTLKPDFYLSNNGINKRSFELECRWTAGFVKEFLKL